MNADVAYTLSTAVEKDQVDVLGRLRANVSRLLLDH